MIGWLKGSKITSWTSGTRSGLIINCSGIGYEVQLLPRQIVDLNSQNEIEIWVHQIHKDEGVSLYGFREIRERDLFRKLINVNGIGPQIALSLLENTKYDDLITAICEEDKNTLKKAQGVGSRMAERILVELKDKLDNFKLESITIAETKESTEDILSKNETYYALKAIGYEKKEIRQAFEALGIEIKLNEKNKYSADSNLKELDSDQILKEALLWLSQNLT